MTDDQRTADLTPTPAVDDSTTPPDTDTDTDDAPPPDTDTDHATPPDIHTDDEPPPDTGTDDRAPLFEGSDDWAGRWDGIQLHFVDEPRRSIEEADQLVDEVIAQLTARLADERRRLEHQWAEGTEPSTEDLRLTLQHYRAFFERLLAA